MLREKGLMKKHGEISSSLLEGAGGGGGEKMERFEGEGSGRSKMEEEKKKWKEEELRMEVVSVFGVPTTTRLDRLVEERRGVLDRLEESETRYIKSFDVNPVTRMEEEENGGGGTTVSSTSMTWSMGGEGGRRAREWERDETRRNKN